MSKGIIAGWLGAGATLAAAYGATDLANFMHDPFVGTIATAAVGGLFSIVAGHLPGAKKA